MTASKPFDVGDSARVVALVMLPFICTATGAGRFIGWIAGVAVVLARWSKPVLPGHWKVAALAGVGAAVIGPVWLRGTAYHLGLFLLAVLGAGILLGDDRLTPRRAVRLAAVGSLTALAFSIATDVGGYLDVGLMHRAGANALYSGVSPWTGLDVPSGAPGAEGTVISGTPYPPATLFWYSMSDWLAGDPRAGGAVAWVLLVVSVTFMRVPDHRPLVLILTSGALPLMLWTGWTELFTVAVVAAAVTLWSRQLLSSLLLGVALASKQYMIVLAPLVAMIGDHPRRLRRVVPLSIAALLALSGFLLGEGYLDAIIGVYGEFEARTDSASLLGFAALLGVTASPPVWLAPVAAMGISVVWAVRSRPLSPAGFLGGSAGVLAVFFLFGTQAFANYWFLVLNLAFLAAAVGAASPSAAESPMEVGDGDRR